MQQIQDETEALLLVSSFWNDFDSEDWSLVRENFAVASVTGYFTQLVLSFFKNLTHFVQSNFLPKTVPWRIQD